MIFVIHTALKTALAVNTNLSMYPNEVFPSIS